MRRTLSALSLTLTLAFALATLTGCATHIRRPSQQPQPAKVKFGTFPTVEITPVALGAPWSDYSANQKARLKIETETLQGLRLAFPALRQVEPAAAGAPRPGVLRIEPAIEEVKFIGGFARFMVGAMAGSSAVLMQVNYRDLGSGQVIAGPEFYEQGNAWAGGYSMGATDNVMLTRMANQIVGYTTANR